MTDRRAPARAVALALASPAVVPAAVCAAADPLRSQQWNLDAVNADAAHRISNGAGAVVAVIDSGVQRSHPDLAGSVIDGPDSVDGDGRPDDLHGHGTNVAGIIAARADNGIGIAGGARAPRSWRFACSTPTAQDAPTINLSVNSAPNVVVQLLPGSPLVQAIERAARADVVVVAAARNDGVPLCAQPLLATKILCVGAVNRARTPASYSNYALRVDIVAPGGELRGDESIISTKLGGGFSGMAGTSQATPHAAAAAAGSGGGPGTAAAHGAAGRAGGEGSQADAVVDRAPQGPSGDVHEPPGGYTQRARDEQARTARPRIGRGRSGCRDQGSRAVDAGGPACVGAVRPDHTAPAGLRGRR